MPYRFVLLTFVVSLCALSIPPVAADTQADPAELGPPNVVLVLVDDVSENLYKYMTEVARLEDEGVTFVDYFSATPWCCPSRATLQTGKYPHNTHVLSNLYPSGGFEQFLLNDMNNSVGVQLQAAGYRTGLLGKYLNGYDAQTNAGEPGPTFPNNFVPPGWDTWFAGIGYHHFSYQMVADEADDSVPASRVTNKDIDPEDYLTDVLAARANAFVRDGSDRPFFLLLAPFASHVGAGVDPEGATILFPPAPRDRASSATRPAGWGRPQYRAGDCGPVKCSAVPWPDTTTPGNFNVVQAEPLAWMPTQPIRKSTLKNDGRRYHLQRIQMLQSVNDMLRDLRETLDETGEAENTYVMFASDNGYHIGEHAIFLGKTTAYDHDVRTPLVVRPPAGAMGAVSTAMVQNTDILPTLLEIAGVPIPPDVDGVSLLPLLSEPDRSWRDEVLLELTNDEAGGGRQNPDTGSDEGKNLAPTYNALRSAGYLYIDYSPIDALPPADGEAEYYDLTVDPFQKSNIYAQLSSTTRAVLNDELQLQTACVGADCAALQGLDVIP